jgi:thiopeptide-type bacteriocin biosynthesis protein
MRNYDLVAEFFLRTPLLPWQTVDQFLQIADPNRQEEFLKQLFSDAMIREAIFIASPTLFSSIDLWVKGEVKDTKKKEKIVQSVTKYLIRMGTRCTPFGLFAGVSSGSWGAESKVLFGQKESNLRVSNLDMEYMFNIKKFVLDTYKELFRSLNLYSNSSIYKSVNKYKFIDYQYNSNIQRKFGVSVAVHTDYLEAVLSRAKEGARMSDLIQVLTQFEVSEEESEEYLMSLIEKQVLITEIEPTLTQGYYFDILLSKLESISTYSKSTSPIASMIEKLQIIKNNLIKLSVHGPVEFEALYENLKLADIPPKYTPIKYFQTDMVKIPLQATLSNVIASGTRKALEVLNKLSTVSVEDNLNTFKDKFRSKYDTRAVSLLEALDPETGILYTGANVIRDITPLIDDIVIPPPQNIRKISQLEWSRKDSILLNKLLESRKVDAQSIFLSDADISDLRSDWNNIPDSINIVTSIVDPEESNAEISILVVGAGLSGASNILSRFTPLHAPIEKLAQEIMCREESLNPQAIVAELVHLPDYSRIGNILQRSAHRRFEVPFMAMHGQHSEEVILLEDLFLCLQNNRLVLFSKKFGKEVQIRLSTAHNYSADTHPIYYFLGDLQFQNMHWPLQFSWGPVERVYRFLPRVVYKSGKVDIILSPASWLFDKKDYLHILEAKDEQKKIYLNEFKKKWQIPQQVILSEYDHDILIDFDSTVCMDVFYQFLSQRENVKFKEFFKPTTKCGIADSQGAYYTNEVVTFFVRKEPRSTYLPSVPKFQDQIQRSFPIGSEWLFFKFYTGTKGADDLLISSIKGITEELMTLGLIDKWFFIRYIDPDYHLRIRFHLKDVNQISSVILKINAKIQTFIDQKVISKVVVDSYDREIERYGENTIEFTETMFFYDSIFCIEALSIIQNHSNSSENRWKFMLKSIDMLLDDFGLSLGEKVSLLKKIDVSESMGINKQTSIKYRTSEMSIEALFSNTLQDIPWGQLYALLSQRSRLIRMIYNQICQEPQNDIFAIGLENYLASIIHMNVNRVCISRPNDHEYVAYDLLFRYYASKLARQKTSSINQNETQN